MTLYFSGSTSFLADVLARFLDFAVFLLIILVLEHVPGFLPVLVLVVFLVFVLVPVLLIVPCIVFNILLAGLASVLVLADDCNFFKFNYRWTKFN